MEFVSRRARVRGGRLARVAVVLGVFGGACCASLGWASVAEAGPHAPDGDTAYCNVWTIGPDINGDIQGFSVTCVDTGVGSDAWSVGVDETDFIGYQVDGVGSGSASLECVPGVDDSGCVSWDCSIEDCVAGGVVPEPDWTVPNDANEGDTTTNATCQAGPCVVVTEATHSITGAAEYPPAPDVGGGGGSGYESSPSAIAGLAAAVGGFGGAVTGWVGTLLLLVLPLFVLALGWCLWRRFGRQILSFFSR